VKDRFESDWVTTEGPPLVSILNSISPLYCNPLAGGKSGMPHPLIGAQGCWLQYDI
jgi:hypothetical protein